MENEKVLIANLRALIEQKVCWGDSAAWVNQDFIALSEKIHKETGGTISHVTLKRLWGKIKYDALPHAYTLNILSQFVGYETWRDFVVKSDTDTVPPTSPARKEQTQQKTPKFKKWGLTGVAAMCLALVVIIMATSNRKKVNPADYTFSSHTTTGSNIPNSVVFNFDAAKAPVDSVIIQQSWDKRLRTTVARNEHEHTLLYYYPGFFQPKLIVDGQVVKQHSLLIPSNGWVTAAMRSPIPVYFKTADAIKNGHLSLTVDQLKAQEIVLNPDVPSVSYCNVQDFGPLYADDFEFETAVKNDFAGGTSPCQLTNIYLLCEGTAIGIPLCSKGCESALNLFFTGYSVSGKKKDLSAFGVDFNDFVRVKIHSSKGKASIWINNKLAYTIDHDINHSKIIGIDYVFQGTGSVDYARLKNDKLSFNDEFSEK